MYIEISQDMFNKRIEIDAEALVELLRKGIVEYQGIKIIVI